MHEKIIYYSLTEAALGNWSKIEPSYISQNLNLDAKLVIEAFPNKEKILDFYIDIIDDKTLKSINDEDINAATKREILLELLMIRLDYMEENRLSLINIANYTVNNPRSLIKAIQRVKISMQKMVELSDKNSSEIKKNVTTRTICIIWLIAFNKWLYSEGDNSTAYAVLDKGLKRIEKLNNSFS